MDTLSTFWLNTTSTVVLARDLTVVSARSPSTGVVGSVVPVGVVAPVGSVAPVGVVASVGSVAVVGSVGVVVLGLTVTFVFNTFWYLLFAFLAALRLGDWIVTLIVAVPFFTPLIVKALLFFFFVVQTFFLLVATFVIFQSELFFFNLSVFVLPTLTVAVLAMPTVAAADAVIKLADGSENAIAADNDTASTLVMKLFFISFPP